MIEEYFKKMRFDRNHHLGLGDIRLTVAQQNEIIKMFHSSQRRFYARVMTNLSLTKIERKKKMIDYPKNHSELYWRTIKNDPPPFTQDEGDGENWTDMVLFFNGYAMRPGHMKKDNISGIDTYDENDKYIKATHWMPHPCPPIS